MNLKFTDVRFQPYQIESKSGFDNPSYCENDIKVIFPAFVAGIVYSFFPGQIYLTR